MIREFGKPLVPSKPVSPKKKITVAAAGVFGVMCGLALVVGLGLLDRTLNTRKQVESTLGLAVLAEIPQVLHGKMSLTDSLFISRDSNSLVSECVRALRTALSAHSPRSVLITSASPGEGKSFCAANLAVLQANMGYRTLPVDADFCRPRMASLLVDPKMGEASEGALTRQNLCQDTIVKNLHLLSCGSYTSDTGEPMSGEIFARMLREAYDSFDCVIIDTSPLNAVSDGLTYSRHADTVVLVVKSGQTEAESARRAVRELQRMRANLVGCVLNGTDEINPDQLAYVEGTSRALQAIRGRSRRRSCHGSDSQARGDRRRGGNLHRAGERTEACRGRSLGEHDGSVRGSLCDARPDLREGPRRVHRGRLLPDDVRDRVGSRGNRRSRRRLLRSGFGRTGGGVSPEAPHRDRRLSEPRPLSQPAPARTRCEQERVCILVTQGASLDRTPAHPCGDGNLLDSRGARTTLPRSSRGIHREPRGRFQRHPDRGGFEQDLLQTVSLYPLFLCNERGYVRGFRLFPQGGKRTASGNPPSESRNHSTPRLPDQS